MTDHGGNLITETQSILNLFQEYFKRILNNKCVVEISDKYQKIIYDTMEPEFKEPDRDEIQSIINSLKNNKSSGEDNINSELLKLAGAPLVSQIQKLIRSIWNNQAYKTNQLVNKYKINQS